MNATEIKGYKWLLKQGYSEADIFYQSRRNPDFLTTTDEGFEVKRLRGKNVIWLSEKQFKELKGMHSVTILVFSTEKEDPILTFPTSQLKPGAIIGGIKISVSVPQVNTEKILLTLSKTILSSLQDQANKRGGINIQELLRVAVIPEWLKQQN